MSSRRFSNGFANESSKSLTEALPEILSSNTSKKMKAEALFKLGLQKKEVEYFLKTAVSKPKVQRFTFTYGVEIECITNCVGVKRQLGSMVSLERYNHVDHHDMVFKFTTDGSVEDNNGHGRNWRDGVTADEIGASECVSPVLKGTKGMDAIKIVLNAIRDNGGYVNSTCGLHVHIGAGSLTDKQYVNVFKNYQKLESVIDTFMAPSRRGNCRWARSLQNYDFGYCQTKDNVDSEIGTRYCKVNPEAYEAHGTIEFRQHQGTVNFKKIQMWVKFLGKLVHYSLENVLTENVASIDGIPFLNKTEKAYFKARQTELANRG